MTWLPFMILSLKCYACLNCCYGHLWNWYECFVPIYNFNYLWLYEGHLLGLYEGHLLGVKMPQSTTYKSLCFGSLSVVILILILILIVIYDISIWTSIVFLFWVCTRYFDFDFVSSRVTKTIGDIMWHKLTFCFQWMWYMICFRK